MSKIPFPDFETDDEFEAYLKSLSYPILKKVARIINKIMRNSKFDVKQSQEDLLNEMIDRLNYEDGLNFFDTSIFIKKEDLPRPSMNLKKPTKKQLKESEEIQPQTIEIDTEEIPPQPIEKDIGDLIKEYIDNEKLKASNEPVYFKCYEHLFTLAIAYILRKHTNDCALIYNTGDEKSLFTLKLGDSRPKNKYFVNYTNESDMKNVAKRYLKCKKNGKILVIPMLPFIEHQNVLFLNGYLNTAERYEPHGDKTYYGPDYERKDIKTQKQLNTFIDGVNKFLPDDDKVKLVPMIEICPSKKGIQSYETKSKELRSQIKNVMSPMGTVKFKDPDGYCCAWSLLMIDLRLRFPKNTIAEINEKMMDNLVSKTDFIQKDLFYFIRGFVGFMLLEIQNVLQKIPSVIDGTFPISDVWDVLNFDKKSLQNKGKLNIFTQTNVNNFKYWFKNITLDDLWTKGILT